MFLDSWKFPDSHFCRDKERQEDEKRINKLYRDVTTGMLRRKRGGDLADLDDSDDDLAERRRRKQEEFARMRSALLADEKVGKIGRLLSSLWKQG
jgi:mediator of replication checkpoint protein 1